MITSPSLLIIALALCVIYWILPSGSGRKVLLALASLGFLIAFTGLDALVILAVIAASFALAETAAKRKSRNVLLLAIFLPLGFIVWAKAFAFEQRGPLWLGALGASYLGFQLIHFSVERYRDNIKRPSALTYFNFSTFFPSLSAGPIKRFNNFAGQEQTDFDKGMITRGIWRIAIGLFKKVVLAHSCQVFVEEFASASTVSSLKLWAATYGYTIQIYMDFSGYTDIALGLALLFGYKIEENFFWPYFSTNISQFWKRWHMSLTSWIRDYIFIPMGGSRVSQLKIVRNTIVTMLVIGLWHGHQPHFILWGLYHAIGLLIFRWYKLARNKLMPNRKPTAVGKIIAVVITFHFVAVGWVFFANDIQTAFIIIKKLFTIG